MCVFLRLGPLAAHVSIKEAASIMEPRELLGDRREAWERRTVAFIYERRSIRCRSGRHVAPVPVKDSTRNANHSGVEAHND